jgi:hypothetical protein
MKVIFTQNGPRPLLSERGLANPTSTGRITLIFKIKQIKSLDRVEYCSTLFFSVPWLTSTILGLPIMLANLCA